MKGGAKLINEASPTPTSLYNNEGIKKRISQPIQEQNKTLNIYKFHTSISRSSRSFTNFSPHKKTMTRRHYNQNF